MKNKFDEIKQFWVDSGKSEIDKDGLKPTARDPWMQKINEYHCTRYLDSHDEVLDVGCGEGSSSLEFIKNSKSLIGVDYSETLIKQANKKKSKGLSFLEGDVLNLDKTFNSKKFDKVISIRCLINLPEKKLQYKALDNMFKVLKPGGILLFSEGYQLGWDQLNIQREKNNLSNIKVVDYNLLFENIELERHLRKHGEIIDFIGFGDYLYGSRIIHPLLTDGKIKHDSKINKEFANAHINSKIWGKFNEYSYAGIFVVKKRNDE